MRRWLFVRLSSRFELNCYVLCVVCVCVAMLDAGNECEFGYGRESEEKKNLSFELFFSFQSSSSPPLIFPLHQTTALMIFLFFTLRYTPECISSI
ncbi:hypothetical protein BO83DRAFT_6403 [Aspergillus eucalypticola CBS 122712]|uniref:Uncharacterized protein n=1 Tax=Aspergillus eucalypticola (strain CBS 122712 / IBT 29274) TaxID=1448314 RepID=A0A317WJN3_ASPEC|nr:uncharacterized protein BO83DRAFT_6403 [Aspergillus eucalypticola CBS 122712]PWY85377.1 hypothetical protein BO83DRAFT_6403 [Aspergillus eucalypticola CBS 122712]